MQTIELAPLTPLKKRMPKVGKRYGEVTPKQARFARLIVGGATQTDAYLQAIAKDDSMSRSNAGIRACETAKKPHVKAYIAALREAAWTEQALTVGEKRAYLAQAVRTPIAQIDENSPLCQEVTETTTEEGVITRKVKAVSKLQAIELDSKIAGHFYADRVENQGNLFGMLLAVGRAAVPEPTRSLLTS